jgi:serine/threonine protein kinase
MPPPISDRYKLEMRLGRDGDIEEWLATDRSLERPVLVRSLGPESSEQRREEFVAAVGAAAKSTHQHLARIYAVEHVAGGAYSVSEWAGAATIQDRVAAGRIMDLAEFLPNAAGLAGALATLHEMGAIHGHIDASAVAYSVAHPAKLTAFGRPRRGDEAADVRSLASILEMAATGSPPGGPPPSESIDGFPRRLDRILRQGQAGRLTAGEMSDLLLATPTPRPPSPEPSATSRRVLLIAGVLVVVAVGLVALGRLLAGGGADLPITPTTRPERGSPTRATTTSLPQGVSVASAMTFDPFGEGGENDEIVGNVLDSNSSTSWQTERYEAPLGEVKPGVGVRFQTLGSPSAVTMIGLSPGTGFELRWAPATEPTIEAWEVIVRGNTPEGPMTLGLPVREDGHWLLWLTDLPIQDDGTYYSMLAEVRFSP